MACAPFEKQNHRCQGQQNLKRKQLRCSHADSEARTYLIEMHDWHQSIVSVMLVEAVTDDEVSVPVMLSV